MRSGINRLKNYLLTDPTAIVVVPGILTALLVGMVILTALVFGE